MKSYAMRFGNGDPRTFTGLSPTFLIFCTDTGTTLASPGISEVLTGSGIYYFNWGTTTAISFLADAATTSPGSARYVTGALDPADRADEYGTTIVAIGTSIIAQGNSNIALGTTAVAIGNTLIFNTGAGMGSTLQALGNTMVALGSSIYGLEQSLGSTMQAIGSTLNAIGTSNIALGTSNIALGISNIALGTTNVAIGTSLRAGMASILISVSGIGTTASIIGDSATDPVDLYGYIKRVHELVAGQQTYLKLSGVWTMYDRTGATLLATRTLTNSASTVVKT